MFESYVIEQLILFAVKTCILFHRFIFSFNWKYEVQDDSHDEPHDR